MFVQNYSKEITEQSLSTSLSASVAFTNPMMSLGCVLKRELVNGMIVYSVKRIAAAGLALVKASVCAWECACVC